MEKKMETLGRFKGIYRVIGVIQGCSGIMEKTTETTVLFRV